MLMAALPAASCYTFLARYKLLGLLACLVMQLLVQQLGDASTSPPVSGRLSPCPPPSARLTCFPPDRAALQEAAASFNSTFLLSNWRAQVDCCSWEGVTCAAPISTTGHNIQSRVVGLALAARGLQGAFPPALCRLSALSSLDLSLNDLSGPIPSCIGHNLTKLQHLILAGQLGFKSTIPHSFSLLLALKTLDLSFNMALFGSISPLANLPLLTSLDLQENAFNETMPIFNTPSLQYLNLHLNSFIGTMPLINNSNLQHLDVSYNRFSGSIPAWIGLFFNLQYLNLSGNNFSGSIPQEWQMLTQLTSLQLSASSPAMPVYLPQNTSDWLFRLPRLEILRLRSMGLTMRDFQCELGLSLLNQTLYTLDLSGNLLSGGSSLWHCLANHNFTFLSQLSLSNNPLAFDLASSPPLSSPLLILDLSFCQLVGSLPMQVVLLSSARLGWIDLGHNHLAGRIPWEIGSLGPYLSLLDLSFNNLTGPIPTSMWNLSATGIILSNNHLDGEIQLSGTDLNHLYFLHLENNHFTKAFFNNIRSIQTLDLSFNKLEGDLQEFFGDYSVLFGLLVLLLSHNELTGSIPASLGRLAPELMVLELSNNQLTGAIPESLKYLLALPSMSPQTLRKVFDDFNLQSVKGVRFTGDSLLGHLDLSSNMLNGSIPGALGELIWLNDLNLSRNHLSGPIPPALSNLTQLQSLDLSYNNLDGSIPQAFSNLYSLEVFNVSFNPKLSGQIPEGTQLEVSDSYKGDPNLCGYQIQKDCAYVDAPVSDQQQQLAEPTIDVDHHAWVQIVLDWIEEWISIPAICLGYALGVGVTIWVLKLLNFYG